MCPFVKLYHYKVKYKIDLAIVSPLAKHCCNQNQLKTWEVFVNCHLITSPAPKREKNIL